MLKLSRSYSLAPLSAALLILGCSEPTGVEQEATASTATVASVTGSPVDLEGSWSWTRVEQLKMPEFVAAMVGIVPEGKNTHARCEASGTAAIMQSGSEFAGVAERTSDSCETNGGQTFDRGPITHFVEDGQIRGNSARFSLESIPVQPCPHNVVIAEVDGSVAQELRGTGRCVFPGHPQSTSPIDAPPPAGSSVSNTLSLVLVR